MHLPNRAAHALRVALLLAASSVALALLAPLAHASNYVLTDFAGQSGNDGYATPGPATATPAGEPIAEAVTPAGDLYIADYENSEIYEVTPTGTLSRIAGSPTGSYAAPTPGPALSSKLDGPSGVAVDAGGNVYVVDEDNYDVEEITPAGHLSVIAGDNSYGPTVAGSATATSFEYPEGVAVNAAGDVFVTDGDENKIYEVTPGGSLSLYAGTGGTGATVAGPALASPLYDPDGLAEASDGDLYVTLHDANQLVKITSGGTMSIVAGTGSSGSISAGPAASSPLLGPEGVALDGAGNVYVTSDYDVAEIDPAGQLTVIAGNSIHGSSTTFGMPATSTSLDGTPLDISSTPAGRLFIADSHNDTIDTLQTPAPVNSTVPEISGTATPGQTLQASDGTWANSPILYDFQWQTCGPDGTGCTDINGATSADYTVSASDTGSTLRVLITAGNSGGAAVAGSLVSALVTATPVAAPAAGAPAPTTTPTTTTTTTTTQPPAVSESADGVTLDAKAASVGLTVSGSDRLTLPLICPADATGCAADGTLALRLAATPRHRLVPQTPTSVIQSSVIARFAGVKIFAGHGRLVSVRLTPAATRSLQVRRVRRVRVTLTVHNHLSGGATVTTVERVWLDIAPLIAGCPAASGTLTGSHIGSMRLQITRPGAHRLGRHQQTGNPHFERYCLTGGRLRVAYPSVQTTRPLGVVQRRRLRDRVVLALTANRHYAIDGVRVMTTIRAARERLALKRGIVIGKNTWYVIHGHGATWVLKAQHGVIHEMGITLRRLAGTRRQQVYLLRHL